MWPYVIDMWCSKTLHLVAFIYDSSIYMVVIISIQKINKLQLEQGPHVVD